MTSALGPAAVEELRGGLLGDLIERGQPEYAEARAIWNGHIERQPALIARCRGVADVIATVRFAREHDVLVAVRGGGHAVAGHALCDDGIVIDLSSMTGSASLHGSPRGPVTSSDSTRARSEHLPRTSAFVALTLVEIDGLLEANESSIGERGEHFQG